MANLGLQQLVALTKSRCVEELGEFSTSDDWRLRLVDASLYHRSDQRRRGFLNRLLGDGERGQ